MGKRKIIFHHPLPLNFEAPSGSGIRPVEMYKAFSSLGYDVELVVGYTDERSASINRVIEKIDAGETYDFCYSEASTMPLSLTDKDHFPRKPVMDAFFFRYLKKKNIKTGVFYRDIYWKFDGFRSPTVQGFIKKLIANTFYRLELLTYRFFVDKLFVPSMEMKKYIPIIENGKFHELNPGANPTTQGNKQLGKQIELLYVGGTAGYYNINLLIEVIGTHFSDTVSLTICTRPDDAAVLLEKLVSLPSNVSVVSKSGRELTPLYNKADCACLYMKPTEYRTFAVPIKLFEYIGHGKPVIASAGTWVGEFVRQHGIGWTVDYSKPGLHEFLDDLIANKDCIPVFSKKVISKSTQYSWQKRCNEIEESLGNIS